MISEVDIRDWDRKIKIARQDVERVYNQTGFTQSDVNGFIDSVERLIKGQTAALFKPLPAD